MFPESYPSLNSWLRGKEELSAVPWHAGNWVGATSVHQAMPLHRTGSLQQDPAPPLSELPCPRQEGLGGSQTLSWQLEAVTQSQVPQVPDSKRNNAHADSSRHRSQLSQLPGDQS